MDSRRGSLLDHGLAELVVSNAVGNHDDAVGVDLLGPRGGHLTMKQTGVDTDVGDLDVPIADDRSRRDGACRSSGGRSRLLLLGLQRLGLDTHASLSLSHEMFCDRMCSVLCVKALRICLDEHRQVDTGDDSPGIVALDESADLVERRAAPQINEEEHLLLVLEGSDCFLDLGTEVVGARDHGNRRLIAKDHRARLLDSSCQVPVASKNNTYHHITSFLSTYFLHDMKGVYLFGLWNYS